MCKDTVLVGCEILCIPAESGLVACPLPVEEQATCKMYLQHKAGIVELARWLLANAGDSRIHMITTFLPISEVDLRIKLKECNIDYDKL